MHRKKQWKRSHRFNRKESVVAVKFYFLPLCSSHHAYELFEALTGIQLFDLSRTHILQLSVYNSLSLALSLCARAFLRLVARNNWIFANNSAVWILPNKCTPSDGNVTKRDQYEIKGFQEWGLNKNERKKWGIRSTNERKLRCLDVSLLACCSCFCFVSVFHFLMIYQVIRVQEVTIFWQMHILVHENLFYIALLGKFAISPPPDRHAASPSSQSSSLSSSSSAHFPFCRVHRPVPTFAYIRCHLKW